MFFFPHLCALVFFFSYTHICLSFVSHDKIPTFIGPAMFDEAFMYELGDGRYLDISLYGPKPAFVLFCGFGWNLGFDVARRLPNSVGLLGEKVM